MDKSMAALVAFIIMVLAMVTIAVMLVNTNGRIAEINSQVELHNKEHSRNMLFMQQSLRFREAEVERLETDLLAAKDKLRACETQNSEIWQNRNELGARLVESSEKNATLAEEIRKLCMERVLWTMQKAELEQKAETRPALERCGGASK
jgi:hypothetical protein